MVLAKPQSSTLQQFSSHGLERTFPKCQFLVSTHSAAVLGHVQHQAAVLLDRHEGEVSARLLTTLGQDANRILEEVFGVLGPPSRY